ncbi:DUF6207 family protein [Streptomyces sp. NPDC052236]|uniref:DUF6207 family protein n=1 Tax=Streptomyces sp. NPDC052236 TaxID=3365686 RepID=UPI0037D83ED0
MEKIDAQHVSEPGLLVLDTTAGDEETVLAAVAELDRRWATSGSAGVRRVPGEPGVKTRLYVDLLWLSTQVGHSGHRSWPQE